MNVKRVSPRITPGFVLKHPVRTQGVLEIEAGVRAIPEFVKDGVRDAVRPLFLNPWNLRVPKSLSGFVKVAMQDARRPSFRDIRAQKY